MDTPKYVRVAVNIPTIYGEFDYSIPENLSGKINPGCLVEVPFNNRDVQGVVTRFVDVPEVPDTKPVSALVDPIPVVTPQQIQLAMWMAEETLTPLCQCIDLMLPPGLASQADTLYEAVSKDESLRGLDQMEIRVMQQLVNRDSLRLHQLERAIPHVSLQTTLRKLQQAGRITSRSVLMPPRVRPKFVRTAALACTLETLKQKMPSLSIFPAVQMRRRRALEYLADEPLPVEVTWVYAASSCIMADLIVLQEMDLIVLSETEVWRDPLKKVVPLNQPVPIMTADQQNAWQAILPVLKQANCGDDTHPILLRGVTGSGKTELYLRAVEETILCGRQAIVLVPEISLTPLAVQRFLTRFPGQVGLVHSRLTPGERYDTWRRARAGVLPVIIGARSALFTPLKNIGLIVVDECHDDSYYQDDFSPIYSALKVAQKMMRLNQAALIMGSATPDVTQLYNARQGNWNYLFLKNRVSFTGPSPLTGSGNFPPAAEPVEAATVPGNTIPASEPVRNLPSTGSGIGSVSVSGIGSATISGNDIPAAEPVEAATMPGNTIPAVEPIRNLPSTGSGIGLVASSDIRSATISGIVPPATEPVEAASTSGNTVPSAGSMPSTGSGIGLAASSDIRSATISGIVPPATEPVEAATMPGNTIPAVEPVRNMPSTGSGIGLAASSDIRSATISGNDIPAAELVEAASTSGNTDPVTTSMPSTGSGIESVSVSGIESVSVSGIGITTGSDSGSASDPGSGLPPVEIVDMREELKAGARSMFSRPLQSALQKVLDANEQAIIFLNRRGSATFIFCYDCGHTIRCPRCEIPLIHHTSDNSLFCHHCGYKRHLPKSCPNCNSERIRHFGTGTEKVEAELKIQFPTARILRWDAETTKEKDAHEIILGHFTAHHADFLVGTQMVAKGHDFPLVTLVGILLAETGLNMPDYRSPERTFQLITQVSGRAGRGEKSGRVILQTYLPEHYAIQAASKHDLDSFYDFEITQRQRLHYPPFTRLARIIFQNLSEETCQIQAEKTQAVIADKIKNENLNASSVGGALPCFFAREGGYYRYQVIIRSPDPVRVLRGIPLKNARVQIDPVDLL